MEKGPKNELLSEEEANVYQDYATKLDGKKFSEQSSVETYKEAEKLIEKLRDSQFDWLGIDWNKIDFNDIKQIQDLEIRLDEAARSVIESQIEPKSEQEKGIVNALHRFMDKHPIPFVLSVAIIATFSAYQQSRIEKVNNDSKNAIKHDVSDSIEIQDVSATSPKNRENLPRWHGIYVKENIQENTEELHITLQDGKKLRCVALNLMEKTANQTL